MKRQGVYFLSQYIILVIKSISKRQQGGIIYNYGTDIYPYKRKLCTATKIRRYIFTLPNNRIRGCELYTCGNKIIIITFKSLVFQRLVQLRVFILFIFF